MHYSASLSQISRAKQCHPKVTAYYFKDWKGFTMGMHSHGAIEIMYVMTGECKIELDTEQLVMKKNQFILIDSKVPHRLLVDKDKTCRMLNIEFILTDTDRNYPAIYELIQESKELHVLFEDIKKQYLLKDTNGVLHTLRNLVFELDMGMNSKKDNYLMVQLLLTQLLLLIARNIIEMRHKSVEEKDLYVKKIIKYLHENYDYDIKMDHLSSKMHLHPNYLHRIFKESMNCTIVDYLTDIRIEKAKLLITQTDIPITEIAGFIGMNSSQYFSKVFKQETGITPTAFRKQNCNTLRVIKPYNEII